MARLPFDVMTVGNRENLPDGQFSVERATGDDFGAGVGRALTTAGTALQTLDIQIKQNQRELQGFDAEARFAELQNTHGIAYAEKVKQISGYAEGWWQGSAEEAKKAGEAFLATIPDPRMREQFKPRIAAWVGQRTRTAFVDQYQQQRAHAKGVLDEAERVDGQGVQAAPESMDAFIERQDKLTDANPALTPEEKEQRKRDIRGRFGGIAASAIAKDNPAAMVMGNLEGVEGYKAVVKRFEGGVLLAPKWDRNAFRAGYSSDTITKPDGTVERVTQDTRVTREDAERDLERRITKEFVPAAVGAIGQDGWQKLSPAAQAVMVSLGYNYGSGAWSGRLKGVAEAAKSGDAQKLAEAVAALAGDNDGLNAKRRNAEAGLIRAGGGVSPVIGAAADKAMSYLTPEQRSSVREAAFNRLAGIEREAQAAKTNAQNEQRNQLFNDLTEKDDYGTRFKEALSSGLLNDYSDRERARTIVAKREEADGQSALARGLLEGTVTPNKFDKGHRDAVNNLYGTAKGLAEKNGGSADGVALGIFDRTGIVPKDFVQEMRAAIQSLDKARMASTLVQASNMLKKNPNAFSGHDGSKEIENAVMEFDRLQEAGARSTSGNIPNVVEQVVTNMRARDEQSKTPLKQEQLQQFTKQELEFSRLQSRASKKLGGDIPPGDHGQAILGDYRAFAEEGFGMFRNNSLALDYADRKMQQFYGKQNGVLMKFAPEKMLPALPGQKDGYAWINEQAAEEYTRQKGVVVDPKQVFLVPVETVGASTLAAFRGQLANVPRGNAKGDTFQSVPYRIVVMPKDPSQDKFDVLEGRVFFPDMAGYIAKKNAATQTDAVSAEQARQEANSRGAFPRGYVPAERPGGAPDMLQTPEQATTSRAERANQQAREQQAASEAAAAAEQQRLQGQNNAAAEAEARRRGANAEQLDRVLRGRKGK